jgi:hypothetical protein
MINKETGEIKFPNWDISLSREITREWFLKSSLALGATVQVKNEPFCSWKLIPTKWDDNKWWTVIVYFEGERLFQVILAASDSETDSGWESWSEESEKHLKNYYALVLAQLLGFSGNKPHKFSWGVAEAGYDERSGSSFIAIRY